MYVHAKCLIPVLFLLFLPLCSFAQNQKKFIVVIDAGHGGKDPGATSGNVKEKDINLSVALKLGKMVADSCPDIRVVYTRMTDVFVGLNERSDLSNRVHADLFLSIHSNSSRNTQARGMETYVMGMEKTSENLSLAMRENSVIVQEDDYTTTYEGYDPSSSESFIIFSLQQNACQNESLKLASEIQNQYISSFSSRIVDKGVKQANFLVLWKTSSPSVLTEIGFISNYQDRSFISSTSGQNSIAKALFRSIRSYYSYHSVDEEEVSVPEANAEVSPSPVEKIYRVQVMAEKKAVTVSSRVFFQWVDNVHVLYKDGYFKYYVGCTNVYEEILSLRDRLREFFPDCFIVTFDGKQPDGSM